mmetsp:Transcript_12563/g.32153  ORF Transcript_12563/g.32153 Transcript_12563/m.32153 type:complete len:308 (+) Transcript_12563:276-1199(+)
MTRTLVGNMPVEARYSLGGSKVPMRRKLAPPRSASYTSTLTPFKCAAAAISMPPPHSAPVRMRLQYCGTVRSASQLTQSLRGESAMLSSSLDSINSAISRRSDDAVLPSLRPNAREWKRHEPSPGWRTTCAWRSTSGGPWQAPIKLFLAPTLASAWSSRAFLKCGHASLACGPSHFSHCGGGLSGLSQPSLGRVPSLTARARALANACRSGSFATPHFLSRSSNLRRACPSSSDSVCSRSKSARRSSLACPRKRRRRASREPQSSSHPSQPGSAGAATVVWSPVAIAPWLPCSPSLAPLPSSLLVSA